MKGKKGNLRASPAPQEPVEIAEPMETENHMKVDAEDVFQFLAPTDVEMKARKWKQLNEKRFGSRRRLALVQAQKEEMPPEHLRKVRIGYSEYSSSSLSQFSISDH